MFTRADDPWDEIDRTLLASCQQPRTLPGLAEVSGLPAETVKSQVHAHVTAGRVIGHVDAGVRYQLTLAGRARLLELARRTAHHTTRKAA